MQLSLLPREISPDTVLDALVRRVGAANGASVKALASYILGTTSEPGDERLVRKAIEHLRTQGHPICAMPEDGYYFAANADELNRACVYLTRRAITSLRQVAAMKRVALPNLYGQLGLPDPDHDPQGAHDHAAAQPID